MKRLLVLGVFATLTMAMSCPGEDREKNAGAKPADVEGIWDGVWLNSDIATFQNCTGFSTGLEGVTVAEVSASAPVCTTPTAFQVLQSNNDLVTVARTFSCDDGSSYIESGIGNIRGNDLEMDVTSESPTDGWMAVELWDGTVVSDIIVRIDSHHISVSGLQVGSCDIEPPLRMDATLSATEGPPRLFSIAARVAARE
jgi:hypothetical protein